ncbi:nuclear transport factor 2 family protein [Spirosoma sp. SC4-14]|uniref:nuclear transport factor 2 family protein n=1 Tax=Spirosoma sp. SC4-14 TaxID=3128900 RepID=UPI0030D4F7D9
MQPANQPLATSPSEALQATQMAYLQRGDIDGMIAACYTNDARMHGFMFRAQGHAAIKELVLLYLERLGSLGDRTMDKYELGDNYIWLEMTIQNPQGDPIKTYEVKFLRNGKVYLQLFGLRQGTLWQPGDFAGFTAPDTTEARMFHERYLDFHSRGDADGLADDFFSDDIRLITARVDVSGREAVRQMFHDLFAKESGFTPLSVENITSDSDYVWFEATVTSSLGKRRVYDIMLVGDGRVHLQLVGQLMGILPTEAAFGSE